VARLRDVKQKFGLQVMRPLPSKQQRSGVAALLCCRRRSYFVRCAGPEGGPRDPAVSARCSTWHVLENLDLKLPFMVSGGLNAGNVAEAVRVTRAGGVDVSSGVERTPGIKDPEMIRAFLRAARATDHDAAVASGRWSMIAPDGSTASCPGLSRASTSVETQSK